jgi:hypothetical protein
MPIPFLRQGDLKVQASLGYTARPCIKRRRKRLIHLTLKPRLKSHFKRPPWSIFIKIFWLYPNQLSYIPGPFLAYFRTFVKNITTLLHHFFLTFYMMFCIVFYWHIYVINDVSFSEYHLETCKSHLSLTSDSINLSVKVLPSFPTVCFLFPLQLISSQWETF